MKMILILESILQNDMKISEIKEYNSKTKFTFTYKDMEQKNCEISHTCAPGHEKDLCKRVINNIISGMYINNGDLEEAQSWLHNEKWDTEEECNANIDKMELLKIRIEQIVQDLENKTDNRHMNDLEYGKYDALNEVLEMIDDIS